MPIVSARPPGGTARMGAVRCGMDSSDPLTRALPMNSPGTRLRRALDERPIMIPGAFNALTAKLAERLGFEAVYLSGGALSAGWAGLPDIGLLTQPEFAEHAAVPARATAPPARRRPD